MACAHITDFVHYSDSPIGKVDTIVGIVRGGLMPAQELSHNMNVPMETINYSSKMGAGDNKNHNNVFPPIRGKSILLVDDICDSGKTLKEIHQYYSNQGYQVFSAAIYYKNLKEPDAFIPDVWAVKISKNFGWIVMPWETNNNSK